MHRALLLGLVVVALCGCAGDREPDDSARTTPTVEAGSARVETVAEFFGGFAFTVRSDGVFDYRRGRFDVTWEHSNGDSGRDIVVDGVWYTSLPEGSRPRGKPWLAVDVAAAENLCDHADPRAREHGANPGREAGTRAAVLAYGLKTSWFGDPGRILDYLVERAARTQLVGREILRGVPTTRYSARLDLGIALERDLEAAGWSPGTIECVLERSYDVVRVDAWIGDDGFARRVRTVATFRFEGDPEDELHHHVFTFAFSRFGAAATIDPPRAEDVFAGRDTKHDARVRVE